MFQITVVEEIKHILCPVFFFLSENLAFYGIIWKNVFRAGQATDDNMAHARYMLDN
jgi:hypothetical protein